MLCRIEEIRNVGLFHEVSGKQHKLEKLALIYAGNGRGKSTLASILSSVASGDSSIIEERVTIDSSSKPAIKLQFNSGHKVEYNAAAWSEMRSEVKVFDTTFIESNVHSGGQINADHRKNLLDFAIGDRAVASRLEEETGVDEQRDASASIKDITQNISPFMGQLPLPVFRSLAHDTNADQRIESLQKRHADAKRAGSITSLNIPEAIPIPHFDIDGLFEVFRKTLDDIHEEAATRVEDHIANVEGGDAGTWISQGQQFAHGDHCPYCGQSTDGVELIQMYRTHFNAAYRSLKDLISETAALLTVQISQSTLDRIIAFRETVNEKLLVWSEYVGVEKLSPELDELAQASLTNLADLLVGLMEQKTAAPAEAFGTSEQYADAKRLWGQFCGVFSDQNDVIRKYSAEVSDFKRSLQNEDPSELMRQITEVQLAKIRHSTDVVMLFSQLGQAETDLKAAEEKKQKARAQLTALMSTTLAQYSHDINRHLVNLGASFQIDSIKTTFTGSKPRTDYGISLRGKSIKLTSGTPSFATALSEGDKRTLAFSFFVASTLADPDLSNHVVVVDDPVSSLDRSRRAYTMKLLGELSEKSEQLVVLAHDANFLRDTARTLTKDNDTLTLSTLQIARVADSYSGLAKIDLDRECETPYYTHYRTVDEYVDGKHADMRQAAVALRPLLEGYLHRKFPGKLPTNLTLGGVLAEIDTAGTGGPFTSIKQNLTEFRELNAFAGKFHHDTNPGFHAEVQDADEIAAYGRHVLAAVHS